jgi:hypothetical protein
MWAHYAVILHYQFLPLVVWAVVSAVASVATILAVCRRWSLVCAILSHPGRLWCTIMAAWLTHFGVLYYIAVELYAFHWFTTHHMTEGELDAYWYLLARATLDLGVLSTLFVLAGSAALVCGQQTLCHGVRIAGPVDRAKEAGSL